MARPRCGHPDVDPRQIDPTRKFGLSVARWSSPRIQYVFETITGDVADPLAVRNAVRRATQTWAAAAPMLTFDRVAIGEGRPQIRINMTSIIDGPAPGGPILAQAAYPPDGRIWFDDAETWSVNGGSGTESIEAVALHEFGHALGLTHSASSTSAMNAVGMQTTTLGPDDRVAINAKYPRWDAVSGPGLRDVAARGGSVWAIGNTAMAGGFPILEWRDGTWTAIDGAAFRITADGFGRPWVVNIDGFIYRRQSGVWQHIPGLLASDIAIDGAGTVWAIARESVAVEGGRIHTWNSATGAWPEFGGLAVRVGAGGTSGLLPGDAGNEVWVVNGRGDIFRKEGSGWRNIPGKAIDVGVGEQQQRGAPGGVPDGPVYVIGNDGTVFIWMKQNAIDSKVDSADTPPFAEWRPMIPFSNGFFALNIAVGNDWVWVTDSNFQVRRARK